MKQDVFQQKIVKKIEWVAKAINRYTIFQLPTAQDSLNISTISFKVPSRVSSTFVLKLILYFLFKDVDMTEGRIDYDYFDVISDFGGICGLLLGASILSTYDLFCSTIYERFKN